MQDYMQDTQLYHPRKVTDLGRFALLILNVMAVLDKEKGRLDLAPSKHASADLNAMAASNRVADGLAHLAYLATC